ncbi:MAG: AbrB/MazE/SpoVT family DNA-binding domain-containing protein [Candidatus Aegiribacteria sp.]|nr:AbrB/MazE/SpoVT family DNA-binding domain-containing protein [Candidatus Aegiribacteria sp.]
MALSTLTSKGQVTIPKAVRDSLHLHAGDKIDFIVIGDGEVIVRAITKKVDDVFGRLHKTGRKPVSVKRMNTLVKERIRENSE